MGVGKEIAGAIGKAIKGTVQRSRAKKNAADLVSKINPKLTGEEYKKAVKETQKMKNRVGRNRAMWYGTAGAAVGSAAPSIISKVNEYKIVKKDSAKPSSSPASKVTAARKEQIAANKQKVKAAGQQYKATTNKEKVAANTAKVAANKKMVAANKKKVAANAARYKKG
jgi:hypothetical protein